MPATFHRQSFPFEATFSIHSLTAISGLNDDKRQSPKLVLCWQALVETKMTIFKEMLKVVKIFESTTKGCINKKSSAQITYSSSLGWIKHLNEKIK